MVKKILIPYYIKFLVFNLAFNGLFIGMLFAFDQPKSEAVSIVLFRFFALFMFVAGFYLVSFIYGMYFQNRHKLSSLKIVLLAGLLFIIEIISFFRVWQPTPFTYGLKTNYLLIQASLQALSFLIGSLLMKYILYFKQNKK